MDGNTTLRARRLRRTDNIPAFLLPVRMLAAKFAGIGATAAGLVTEYSPGAPIGWHKDKLVFGRVVGISLLSACTFRLRRRAANGWQRATITLELGSGY
jgi:alkylated DNA repair dioxygenase AlkB